MCSSERFSCRSTSLPTILAVAGEGCRIPGRYTQIRTPFWLLIHDISFPKRVSVKTAVACFDCICRAAAATHISGRYLRKTSVPTSCNTMRGVIARSNTPLQYTSIWSRQVRDGSVSPSNISRGHPKIAAAPSLSADAKLYACPSVCFRRRDAAVFLPLPAKPQSP